MDKVARKETQSSSKSVDVAALEALSSDKRLVVVTLGICKHLDKPRQPTIKRLEERLARIASNVKGQ